MSRINIPSKIIVKFASKNMSFEKSFVWDSVHGRIRLCPLQQVLLKTPYLQRLNRLKQMGCAVYNFPGASHTRLQHSIGVSHLARTLYRQICTSHRVQHKQTHENLLVVAGLCHDLGHGPHSHAFEDYMQRYHPEKQFDHEQMSKILMEHSLRECLDNQKARRSVTKKVINWNQEWFDCETIEQVVEIVGSMICGKTCDLLPLPKWLYQVVHNSFHGVDVDKIDYLVRDTQATIGISDQQAKAFLNIQNLLNAFVLYSDDHSQHDLNSASLLFKSTQIGLISDLLLWRKHLHRTLYKNPLVLHKKWQYLAAMHDQNVNFDTVDNFLLLDDCSAELALKTKSFDNRNAYLGYVDTNYKVLPQQIESLIAKHDVLRKIVSFNLGNGTINPFHLPISVSFVKKVATHVAVPVHEKCAKESTLSYRHIFYYHKTTKNDNTKEQQEFCETLQRMLPRHFVPS